MTPLGYSVLAVGLAAFLFSERWLYRLLVFWTLFSASSAANFGQGDGASALQVWMVFGLLWLLRGLIDRLGELRFPIDRRIAKPVRWLCGFLLSAALSLLMPLWINGRLRIAAPRLGDLSSTPLYLTSHNLTQFLYLAFGILIAICVAQGNLSSQRRHDTERTILIAGLFVSLWGLLQFACNVTGIPYPDYIFNNSASMAGKGFLEALDGVGRISSVTVEPSILGQSLISLLPLTIPSWLGAGSVFSRRFDRFCSTSMILCLLLSTSSMAYAGLCLAFLVALFMLRRTRTISFGKAMARAVLFGGMAVIAGIIAASILPVAQQVLNSALLQKASSGSALERTMTVVLAFGYFQKYPVLGIGWGSATSHDFFVLLLSNVGVIGTFAFIGAIWLVMKGGWQALRPFALPIDLSRFAWILSVTLYILTSVFSGFPLAFGNFWLILGMAVSVAWNPEAFLNVGAAVSGRIDHGRGKDCFDYASI